MNVLLLLALALAVQDAPPSPGRVAEVQAALDEGLPAIAPGARRAAWASGALLGVPYGDSPLGEGSGRDPDPTFRLDRFDCVSFVETVLAFGRARSVAEATALLDDVRYRGPPSYRSRNHYVESQWLPSLAGKRWLEDVTPAVGGDDAVHVTVRHGLADWLAAARTGRLLAGLDPKEMPSGESRLGLVSIEKVRSVASRIPHGSVVIVVREERQGRPSRVVHMGLVVVDERGRRAVRHASRDAGRVVEETLERFVARYEKPRKWPVQGFSFWGIRESA